MNARRKPGGNQLGDRWNDWDSALRAHRMTRGLGHTGLIRLRTHAPDVLRACARMARTNHMSEE